MNADKYWQKLVEKNPAFGKADDEKITLTVRGIRNVVKQAHETGYKDHIETEELMKSLFRVPKNNSFF